jgi:hypothetical protein
MRCWNHDARHRNKARRTRQDTNCPARGSGRHGCDKPTSSRRSRGRGPRNSGTFPILATHRPTHRQCYSVVRSQDIRVVASIVLFFRRAHCASSATARERRRWITGRVKPSAGPRVRAVEAPRRSAAFSPSRIVTASLSPRVTRRPRDWPGESGQALARNFRHQFQPEVYTRRKSGRRACSWSLRNSSISSPPVEPGWAVGVPFSLAEPSLVRRNCANV